jgi:hypothetical protein
MISFFAAVISGILGSILASGFIRKNKEIDICEECKKKWELYDKRQDL